MAADLRLRPCSHWDWLTSEGMSAIRQLNKFYPVERYQSSSVRCALDPPTVVPPTGPSYVSPNHLFFSLIRNP